MRINTSGKKEWRGDLYEKTAERLGENSKSGAIDTACIHTNQDIEAKKEALKYLQEFLPPEQLQQTAEILSTDEISVSVDLEASVSVDGE